MSPTAYYYSRMDRGMQEAYHALVTGMSDVQTAIRIPRLGSEALSTLFFQLRLDHPELFFAVGYSCRAAYNADTWEFLPEYMFPKAKIREHQKALRARIERLTRPMQGMTPPERERYIHDFILENVRYDKLEKPYSHEVKGPLTNGVGVCEGIAKTVKLLCDAVDLPCIIAISDRDRANGEKYLHAWNIVTINGKRYHLDATFDNTLSKNGVKRYDYYNLDDKRIFRDHRALLYPVPECTDADGFFYRTEKLSFTKPEDVEKRVDQMCRKKRETFVFHWRGGYLTRDTLSDLCQRIAQTAAKRDRGVEIHVNWPQAVLQVRFTDQKPMTVTDEDAGEDVQ
ncbi:MAG: peptidase [Oscillospiraceae bacterium]|nr:peptidase [Oscillospiraceae bacterium]